MSVYLAKRKDGTLKSPFWQFDFVLKINGERRRVHGSTGETKEKAARDHEAKEKARLKSERPLDHMTLAAACFRYDDEVGQHRASQDDMAKAYEHCCRLIGGARRLVNVTAEDIATAVRKRSAETVGVKEPRLVAPATVNRQIVEPMKRLMRRASITWGMSCSPEKIAWKDLAMKEPQGRTRELSADEGFAFWAALRADYHPFVRFLAGRGFRVRATIGMKKFDVDLNNGTAAVWKKGVGKVKVPLSQDQVALIRQEMKLCPSSPKIWTYVLQRGAEKGKRRAISYYALRRVIGTAFKTAGIEDFHIHDLRHDFASKLLRKTRNLALVKDALGHVDIKSTVRYAHVLADEISEGMEGMTTGIVPESNGSQAKSDKTGN